MSGPPNPYLASPASGRGPGVLVLHPWWGLNDFMRAFCDRLAREGFVALAPDLFAGRIARTIPEAEQLVAHLDEAGEVAPKVLAALEALHERPEVSGEELGAVGFSFGAFWALQLAEQRPEWLRAVTLFYGTNSGGGDFRRSKAAFLGHFAENDPYEPVEGIQALENNLLEAGRPVAFHTYAGTGHWFFESDRPEAHHPQAARLAWERTVAFLCEELEVQ